MTTYPIEFHRRLEQKWASRIEQILTVTGTAPHREIPTTTMMTIEDEDEKDKDLEPPVVREPEPDE